MKKGKKKRSARASGTAVEEDVDAPDAKPVEKKKRKKESLEKVKFDVQASIRERFGSRLILRPACEVPTCFDLRRPCGITDLDIATSGGIPAGACTMLYGPASVGKDYVKNLFIREIQRTYGEQSKVLLGSFGYIEDMRFMKYAGVQIAWSDEDIRAYERSEGEKFDKETVKELKTQIGSIDVLQFGAEFAVSEFDPAAMLATGIIDAIRSGEYQLVVLNEMGAQLTDVDDGDEVGDRPDPGTQSRFWDSFFRWYFMTMNQTSHTKPNETSLLLISQIRGKWSHNMSWNAPTGGNPTQHALAEQIEFKSGKMAYVGETPLGKPVRWTVKKGKLGGREGDSGEFMYKFSTGADLVGNLVASALSRGVIEWKKDSAEFNMLGKTYYGTGDLETALADQVLFDSVRKQVFKAAGLAFRTR